MVVFKVFVCFFCLVIIDEIVEGMVLCFVDIWEMEEVREGVFVFFEKCLLKWKIN